MIRMGWAVLLLALVQPVLAQLPIQTWHTDKGLEVWFVPAEHLPMVDLRISFDAGSSRDGDLPGLALLTNGMMVEGSGELDGVAVAERMAAQGALLTHQASRDQSWLALRSLSWPQYRQPALQLFTDLLASPSFPERALERDRQALLLNLKASRNEIDERWKKQLYQHLYNGHPYEHLSDGTAQALKRIQREDVVAFHQRYFVARNAVLAIVGDLNQAQAEAIAEKISTALPQGSAAEALPAAPQTGPVEIREAFASSQSHVVMAQAVLQRDDPDYYALYLGNHILGGSGFSSRLVKEIRQKRGLSYSVYSYFVPMRAEGPFLLALQTRNDQAEKALSLLRDELQRFIDKGPSQAEIEHAKSNILGGFARRVSSNAKLLRYLSLMGVYDLPTDYLDRFAERIETLTRDQVHEAFKRRVKPEQMLQLIIGGAVEG